MKKILFSLALMAAALPGVAADGDLHVKGNVKNVGDTLVVLNNGTRDTILVKNGQFEFTTNLKQPTMIMLATPATLRRQESKYMRLIAIPNETAELTGDITSRYDITGSKFYQEYHAADLVMEEAMKPMTELTESLNKRMEAGESQEALMKEYGEKSTGLREKAMKTFMDFIKQHPASEASAAIIPELDGLKMMEEAVGYLSESVRNGRMKSYYQEVIDQAKQQEEAEANAAKKQAAGIEAPAFTLNDINGKPLSLASLRGKYVILDFWGSWCGWCIKGFPQMKEYYNKYKGKFEILGIDCNDTEAKWKDAVKKHELPWLHVYNTKDSKVLADYGITGFPTKILIGPDGKIVKTIVGEDPAFYTFLDETFSK